MVTSGLFQIKGNVKVKESPLDPSDLKRTSYWKRNGYISFGDKYLSYRAYPDAKAIHIPYTCIRKIELEDKVVSVSDPEFMSKLKPNQYYSKLKSNKYSLASGNIGIKSTLTIKKIISDQNVNKVGEERISDVYLSFGYQYLTVITIKENSKGEISFSESKLCYDKIRSMEFEDKITNMKWLKLDLEMIESRKKATEARKELEARYGPQIRKREDTVRKKYGIQ